MCPIQLLFPRFITLGYSCPPILYVILLSNWSWPSFCSITFQYFWGISDLLSEMSKFQHHKKIYAANIAIR